MEWRENEERIITVTPVAIGIVRPALVAVVLAVLVQIGSFHVSFIHRHEAWFLLLLVGPALVIVATRTWRWRSHKIHLTTQRLTVEGGVARHYRRSVELIDVFATRGDQRVSERISRRGSVILETAGGPFFVGRVRHPSALCRLIERERSTHHSDRVPLDTVFEFDDPSSHDYEVNPRRRWGHR